MKKPLRLVIPAKSVPRSSPSFQRKPKVAVVIPAYNEELNIETVLRDLVSVRESWPDGELIPIVVNDGSSDGTQALLEGIGPKYGAKCVHLPLNLGIGKAVQTGFQLAVRFGADVALQLDGDGQHPASEIFKIVAPVLAGQTDVAVGSRYVGGAGGNVSGALRESGTRFFSLLLKALVRIDVLDTTSGFRAFNSEATLFLAQCYPDDYPEVEAYVPLARKGFRIHEVPVAMKPRAHGSSSITPLKSVYFMVKVAFATTMSLVRALPYRRKPSGDSQTGAQSNAIRNRP